MLQLFCKDIFRTSLKWNIYTQIKDQLLIEFNKSGIKWIWKDIGDIIENNFKFLYIPISSLYFFRAQAFLQLFTYYIFPIPELWLYYSKSLLILGLFKNLFSGFPPIIYLTLNKTVRNDTKALFKKIFSSLKIVKDSSVGSNNQRSIRGNTWM